MCGISGVVARGSGPAADVGRIADAMSARIVHRGPDADDVWTDDGVALAHRRLAIIDLTEAGAQPMVSADGRWVIVYNGELYNTHELRDRIDLTPSELRGHSDTEVLLEAIARRGVVGAVEAAVGMFAFAAWDRVERALWLARDRFGEKPIYYAATGDRFVFASELPALEAGLPGRPELDAAAVAQLLRSYYISAPTTIYRGVHQLEPGTCLRIDNGVPAEPIRYWNPVDEARTCDTTAHRGEELVDQLDELLERIVRSRMVSDVPLGAFLSGGTDSATVVAMMERIRPGTRTFTIGFEDAKLDESAVARQTAAALGTTHEELIVTGADALAVVPKLAAIYGEPFADSSQIPTHLVSEFTRRHVTVSLSGDAGDELFGGYERYRYFERLLRTRRLPGNARRALAKLAESIPAGALESVAQSKAGGALPRAIRNRPATRARKMALMLRAGTEAELYGVLRSVTDDPWSYIASERLDDRPALPDVSHLSSTELAMMVDTLDYLPNDILTKVDRAAMAVSLETRVPFLDPELFRFAWSLHPDDRVRAGQGKWVLRKLLARYVPREITELPKRGFGVPIDEWLRGPLQGWAEPLLDDQLLREQGVLRHDAVRSLWARHQSGREQLGPQLWPILMLQSWLNER